MIKYGFELEGFVVNQENGEEVLIPPAHLPCDGFPGLVEVRTSGGKTIEDAFGELITGVMKLDRFVDFKKYEHKFTGAQMAELRRSRQFQKDFLDIKNIYGKEPKALNGRTLAAFQINVSEISHSEQKVTRYDKDGKSFTETVPARYGQLDVPNVVRRLDKEFGLFIKATKRQPGMYAIKDGFRLEYRSLPNIVFSRDIDELRKLMLRIKKAVEG